MRLTDLDPRWTASPGRHGQGIRFLCPACRVGCCGANFDAPLDGGPPLPTPTWSRTGDTFETLTLAPSIDASAAGHWHGFITNGEVR